jgi:RNA polymerase sigma-70 factor, ECF subfamily
LKDPDSDRQLVEQVLGGKADAFNLLVWRWERQLFNFLLRWTGERTYAQDICQEAFLQAYLHLKDLREKEKFGSWLFRIAVNLWNSTRRQPSLSIDDSTEPENCASLNRAGGRELELTVRTLLSRLRPEHRAVVVLKVFYGFRFDEIAAIVNCPVSTVKSRLYTAFELLQAAFETVPSSPHAGT